MRAGTHACPWSPEEVIGSPTVIAKNGYEPPNMVSGNKVEIGFLEEHSAFLNTEPSAMPHDTSILRLTWPCITGQG